MAHIDGAQHAISHPPWCALNDWHIRTHYTVCMIFGRLSHAARAWRETFRTHSGAHTKTHTCRALRRHPHAHTRTRANKIPNSNGGVCSYSHTANNAHLFVRHLRLRSEGECGDSNPGAFFVNTGNMVFWRTWWAPKKIIHRQFRHWGKGRQKTILWTFSKHGPNGKLNMNEQYCSTTTLHAIIIIVVDGDQQAEMGFAIIADVFARPSLFRLSFVPANSA